MFTKNGHNHTGQHNKLRLKTLFLGLAVILMTFIIFVGMPSIVPSFKSFSCASYISACSKRGMEPVIYHTVLWKEKTSPEPGQAYPMGKIKVEPIENSSNLSVTGYLLYAEKIDEPGMFKPAWNWHGGLTNRTILMTVRYYYDDMDRTRTETFEVQTGEHGFYSYELAPDPEAICIGIMGVYAGEILAPPSKNRPVEIYHPCKGRYSSCPDSLKEEDAKSWWWIWLITGLFVLGIAVWIYYFRRNRRYFPVKDIYSPPEVIKTAGVTREKKPETGGDTARIEISFPDIEVSLPGVWGLQEPLQVIIKLKDKDKTALQSQSCEVYWGDGETIQGNTDEDGSLAAIYTFMENGEYRISIRYTDTKSGKEVSGWRRVRIVEYREEMVRLFNEMLEDLSITDLPVDPEMTAREIETLLLERLEGVPPDAIRRVVEGFEEANYSPHAVGRERYEAMYRAVREVLDHGG